MPPSKPQRRTRVRFETLALISVGTMINYLDRTVLGIAAPSLTKELHLDAVVARSYKEVRIVHGKGTGALRSAVEKYLRGCRFVKGFRPGTFGEGESGVTVVSFK